LITTRNYTYEHDLDFCELFKLGSMGKYFVEGMRLVSSKVLEY